MNEKDPNRISRAVTRTVMQRAGLSAALMLCAAPCCLWAALRTLERGLPELWSFSPMAGFVLLAAGMWTEKLLRAALVVLGAAALAAAYLFLR